MEGNIHSVETFGTVDGPGIRFVIFTQGCNLRCAYCHNPDTWECGVGETRTVDSLVEEISKYTRYIDGVTVSGGEPLLQLDFVIELFTRVKAMNLSTCIDTAGAVYDSGDRVLLSKLDRLMEVCDLVMLDIKHIDSDKHRMLTGKTNENILDFARYLSDKGKDIWLRYVLVPTINSDIETLKAWKNFANTLRTLKKIEILPYHKLALNKYEQMGLKYRLDGVDEPTKEQIKIAENILITNF